MLYNQVNAEFIWSVFMLLQRSLVIRGGAGRKTVSLIFNPLISFTFIMISMKKYGEKKKIIIFPALRFHGNGGHL